MSGEPTSERSGQPRDEAARGASEEGSATLETGGESEKSAVSFASHEGSATLDPAEKGVAVLSPGEEGSVTAGGSYPPEVRARLEQDAKEIIVRYPRTRSALLPLLHLVQSEDGYVSDRGQEFCAEMLGLTKAEVVGVSTFYTMYKRRPMGDYHVGVCINTLCAVMGGDQIWEELSEHVGVGHDEATPDGKISLERLECNAACDFAPVMMVNWEFFDNQTPASAKQLVDDLRDGKDVSPTRGPKKLCTFKEASRVLSGLTDDLAGDGPSAAGASLEGLKVAKANGWKAPEA